MAKRGSSSYSQVIKDFKLRPKTDVDGTTVCFGKLGQLYEYDDGVLGAMFMAPEFSKGWSARLKAFLAAGAELHQNGDNEGSVTFPASEGKLVRLACKLLRIPSKRSLSPEQREAGAARLAAWRAQKGGDTKQDRH